MNLLLLPSLFIALLPVQSGRPPGAPASAADGGTCHAAGEAGHVASATPLRPLREWIGDLIREARKGSATLDCLIRTAESTGAVIYIDEAEADHHSWGGRTILTGASAGFTYLRIELHRLRPWDAAALLAHELQHVLEIASSGVTTQDEVVHLYQRIGVESRGFRESHFDTAAAIRAGQATLEELRRRRVPAPTVMASE